MAELSKDVRLAAPYGELSEPLQQRIKLRMEFFLHWRAGRRAIGEGTENEGDPAMSVVPEASADGDARIFCWDAESVISEDILGGLMRNGVLDPCVQKQKMVHIR